MAEHKLNIFQVLGSIGKKNKAYYSKMTDEERKSFHPLVVSRWLSGTYDAGQIVMLNEIVNPYVFPLTHHKELMANLLTAASSGDGGRVKWVKAAGKKTSKTPTITNVIRDYFGYNTGDAIEAMSLLSDADILLYAEHLGRQPDDIKLIKKELKSRS